MEFFAAEIHRTVDGSVHGEVVRFEDGEVAVKWECGGTASYPSMASFFRAFSDHKVSMRRVWPDKVEGK